jgi:hypothetical protein
VIPALPEEYDASMPIGAYYPKREASANLGVPRGLSHYPQHIIAQAEAQKNPQAKDSGPSTSSSQQQEGSTLTADATQGNHMQISLPPASSARGLNIQHYQPQKAQASSQGSEKRATRSSTNANAKTSASSTSGRSTGADARGSQRQSMQQQQASAAGTCIPSTSEAMRTTLVGLMSQFPVPGSGDTSHSVGRKNA